MQMVEILQMLKEQQVIIELVFYLAPVRVVESYRAVFL